MIRYLITDPDHYPQDLENFSIVLQDTLLRHNPTHICYRDKTTFSSDKARLVVSICKEHNICSVINGDIDSAALFKADAVHLSSSRHGMIAEAKRAVKKVIASCHTLSEVQNCIESGADMVTLGPVFQTPDKPILFDIDSFADACELYPKKLLALGGIVDDKQLRAVGSTKAAGFASIRYFLTP